MIDERVEGEHCGQSTCQGRGRAWARVWVWRARAARCLARPRVPGRGGPAMMLGGPCARPGHCPRPGNGARSCSHKKAADQERTAGQALGLFLALARMSCHEATDQGASPRRQSAQPAVLSQKLQVRQSQPGAAQPSRSTWRCRGGRRALTLRTQSWPLPLTSPALPQTGRWLCGSCFTTPRLAGSQKHRRGEAGAHPGTRRKTF